MLARVTAFDHDTDTGQLEYRLMMDGPVHVVHRRIVLDTILGMLRELEYDIVVVDASWLITSHMFRDLGAALAYACHDQWECLDEGLTERLAEAWRAAGKFALILTGFDVFERERRDDAHRLLELVMEHAWPAALLGMRLLCLVYSDDPELRLRPLRMSVRPW